MVMDGRYGMPEKHRRPTGREVLFLRTRLGFKQTEFGVLLNVSSTRISKLENDEKDEPLDDALAERFLKVERLIREMPPGGVGEALRIIGEGSERSNWLDPAIIRSALEALTRVLATADRVLTTLYPPEGRDKKPSEPGSGQHQGRRPPMYLRWRLLRGRRQIVSRRLSAADRWGMLAGFGLVALIVIGATGMIREEIRQAVAPRPPEPAVKSGTNAGDTRAPKKEEREGGIAPDAAEGTGRQKEQPPRDNAVAKPAPAIPFNNQERPPCGAPPFLEVNGGCYVEVATVKPPCPERFYEHAGKCLMVMLKTEPQAPQSERGTAPGQQ
jgi:transcriptional regulator with XRE-family HTH domain